MVAFAKVISFSCHRKRDGELATVKLSGILKLIMISLHTSSFLDGSNSHVFQYDPQWTITEAINKALEYLNLYPEKNVVYNMFDITNGQKRELDVFSGNTLEDEEMEDGMKIALVNMANPKCSSMCSVNKSITQTERPLTLRDSNLEDRNLSSEKFIQMEKIGEGATGNVHKCMNERTKEYVAIKTLSKGDSKKWYRKERDLLARFRHPTVLPLIGYIEASNDDLKLVVPYMEHKDLLTYQKENPNMDFTTKFIIAYGSAYGLLYIHKNNYLHLDFKNQNVFLDEKNYPHVGDFGLAVDENIQLEQFHGTEIFIAPEMLTGLGTCNKKTDVFAYAITIYYLFSGHFPFTEQGQNPVPFLINTKYTNNERPIYEKCIPMPIWELIVRCWDQEPSERPSFEEIVRELNTRTFVNLIDVKRFEEYKKYIGSLKCYENQ